ncbi:MAG: Eco57I restriction-modification methylase domain-containing protein [Planctomycetaceae bacterium]|jgi:23S rRNA G2445 N2-methylase RlmL|nr:Eco57I restriction-modification methylase domain-containing protein [Planctomycetaceae bacterium]
MKLYAFITPEISKNDGYLKIGETRGDVDKRIKEQGHTLNTQVVKVWQDAINTDRSNIDKRIHKYMREHGFHNPKFQDTGEYTELIKCTVEDLISIVNIIKKQIYNEELQREEVGKQFYLEIRNWFYWTAKIGNDPYSIAEPEYTLRLIIRLLLCFFLQDKGLVPKELFDENFINENLKSGEEYRYYNAILRNLFFNCLNTPAKDRNEPEHKKLIQNIHNIKEQFNKVPFLNGGLFYEIEGDDFPLNHEHFFCEPTTRYILELDGNYKVAGIIKILSQYKYKLSVDDLDDAEYTQTVDPEFIGKVFESLLVCIDADSKENRRKITGSFYTPREIVDYMVNEALDAYLQNYSQKNLQKDSQKDSALLQCKILDPACGSGAFPCGVMNEIMRRLDPDKKLTQQERYHKKLEILQKVIYCVDIQSMAVQISSLRFFLALIQEIIPDKKKDNYGIEPLPNLETKFVCANALISLKKEKNTQLNLEFTIVKATIEQLLQTRQKHLITSNMNEKEQLQKYDKSLRKTLSVAMEESGDLSHETAKLLMQWNPYDQTKSTPFFDPHWMFGIEDGFDIVIGNPPYIQLQNNGGALANLYEPCKFKTFARTGDIYCLFYEQAYNLLKNGGHACFITSNKWMRTSYGENTRKFLAENTNPKQLIDFSGVKIFESATVDVNILIFSKDKNKGKTKSCSLKNLNAEHLNDHIKQHSTICQFKSAANSWIILSPIEQQIKTKIDAIGTPLKDWDIKINYGIKTGCNNAFIIDGKKKNELIAKDPKSAEIIKPLLRGRDIKKYDYELTDLWLLFIPWHFPLHNNVDISGPSKKAELAFQKQYPAIYNHLLQYKKELSARNKAETGIRYEWYALQRWGANYWEDFNKQKIVWARLMRISKNDFNNFPRFAIVPQDMFVVDSLCFFTGNDLFYLQSVLNSEIAQYYFFNNIAILDNGGMQMRQQYIELFPIPIPSQKINRQLSELVNKLRDNVNNANLELINKHVYNLYGLNNDEQLYIKQYLQQKKEEIINCTQIE